MELAAIVGREEGVVGPGPEIPIPTREERIEAAREILRREPDPWWEDGFIVERKAWWTHAYRDAMRILREEHGA